MAGNNHVERTVLSLLLISFISTGIKGEHGLIFKERAYDLTFPCKEDLVCFYMWQISMSKTTEYVAIVSNGRIRKAVPGVKKCTFQIKDLKQEDVGQHRCQQTTHVFTPHNASSVTSELNSVPVKTVSLQCVSLTYVEQGRCSPQQQQWVSLTWVDEVGTVIETDAEHQIQQESSCDITLTVPLHTTRKKTFRCQATVAEHVETSLNITVGASGIEHKGRRFIIEPAPQGGSQDGMIGGAVGVVGCAVLAAVVVVLVLHKRRTNIQMPDGQCSVQSNTNNVMNTDDVIYVNVILPAGSESVCVHECESTEYACVRY